MIRDTLIGILLLACLGLARELLGPTGTLVASAACAIGFLAREVWDRRRRELAERRSLAIMNRNRERIGLAPLGFPDRPIIPTRDARFERCGSCGERFDPTNLDEVLYHAVNHKPAAATGIQGRRVR